MLITLIKKFIILYYLCSIHELFITIFKKMVFELVLPILGNRYFSYSAEDYDNPKQYIGCRALVPFGKREITGYIVSVVEKANITQELKPISELLDIKPVFSREMLKFTSWIADYYLASWGSTLKAALPQGMSAKSVLKIKIIKNITNDDIAEIAKKAPKRAYILKELMNRNNPVSVNFLEKQLNLKIVGESLNTLEQLGFIECVRLIEKDIAPKVQYSLKLHPDFESDLSKIRLIFDELDKAAPKQAMLLSHVYLNQMSGNDPSPMSDVLKATKTSSSVVDGLVNKNYIIKVAEEVNRYTTDTDNSLATINELNLKLTDEQSSAVDTINELIDNENSTTVLLHGVTGSGKTLVYLHSIKRVIEIGKTALFLVPEISLTPQLIDRFEKAFPKQISVLHSKMSEGERFDSWRKIKRGEAKIVIGARSGIFAPLENIGIIIVDEEHEPSFKQDDPEPRYNARDCAIVRGKFENTVVVLGSATPSIESMHNALVGKYKLLEIKHRADESQLPKIELVNTLEARKRAEMNGIFSKHLLSEIADRVKKNEGVILFQNRRGFSTFMECPDCAYIPMCENCDVTLTYHKSKNQLRCHYCGYITKAQRSCPACGYVELSELGTGTQKIEEELEHYLNAIGVDANISRVDLDTTSRKGALRKILTDFKNGIVDILVGTQIVAKGLDFERVTLVGVINADLQLFLPDFRAGERTFQLITQVSGRSGRSKKRGKVIIQTSNPDNFAVRTAINNKYRQFFDEELEHRLKAHYPPYFRFIMIQFSAEDMNLVHKHVLKFAGLLPRRNDAVEIMPNFIPSVAKVRKRFRRMIVIKNNREVDPAAMQLKSILLNALNEYRKRFGNSKVRVSVDIDTFSSI